MLFTLVAIIVMNILIKNYVANRLEQELASKGLKVEIGEFDYSLIKKEVMVEGVTAVHMAADDFEVFGNMNLDRGVIKISSLGKDGIAYLDLEGARMEMGSIDEIKFIPGVSFEAKRLKVNNPKEFGGGSLVEFNEVVFHFKKSTAIILLLPCIIDDAKEYFSTVKNPVFIPSAPIFLYNKGFLFP